MSTVEWQERDDGGGGGGRGRRGRRGRRPGGLRRAWSGVSAMLLAAGCLTAIVFSALAEISVLPSGLNTTQCTSRVCPLIVICSLPVARFHNLIVLSKLAEATVLPSGLTATE